MAKDTLIELVINKSSKPKHIYCGECGRCLNGKKVYEDEHYAYLCQECLLFFHRKEGEL